jgi:uncharacterized membrane protein SirB2
MENFKTDLWNIDFGVSKSMRYHAYMRNYWDAADHWNKVLILLSGAAIVVTFLSNVHWLEPWVAGLVAFLSILDIVFGFSDHARMHNSLYRQFCYLSMEIAGTVAPKIDDIAKWRAKRLEIETEETGIWEWLNRRCYREEAKARGIPKEQVEALLRG